MSDLPDHHLCPHLGATVAGDELDCPSCRAGLLAAFRDPAAPPLPGPAPVPHIVSDDPGRVVDMTAIVRHDPVPLVVPHPDRPGGLWSVRCGCGWQKNGHYVRDGMGELAAGRLASTWAERHRANPLEDNR